MPPKSKNTSDDGGGGGGRDWGHPDGMPLTDVEVGAEFDGIITNVGQYGVFVDFGAVKDGLLRIPMKIGRRYRRGMEVKGVKVLTCDPEAGRIVMQLDEDALPEPPPRRPPRARSLGRGGGQDGGGQEDGGEGDGQGERRRRRRDWSHEGATSLDDLQEGDVFEGKVTNVSTSGSFVDIGAVRDARLNVKASIGRRFRIGDVVQDCKIESIDLERGRMAVSVPDPEAAVADLPPKERAPKPKAKAEGKAKANGKAKGKAQGTAAKAKSKAQRSQQEAEMDLEDLHVGDVVDGTVVSKSSAGVFIDIGCGKDARLSVPRRIGVKFMRGDEVCGMRIESLDLEQRRISVALDDPELMVDSMEHSAPRGKRGTSSQPASRSAGSGGRDSSAGPKRSASAPPRPTTKAKAKAAAAPKEWRHADGLPVSRFRAGSTADGVVTKITPKAVFVDVGAVTDGVLKLPRAIAKQIRVGDEVHGMVVDAVDREAEKITLTLEEPELEEPAPQPPVAKAKGKAKPAQAASGKAKARARQSSQAAGAGGREPSRGHRAA